MTARIVAVGIGMNKNDKLDGDTVFTAVLADDTVVVLDNWYSDLRAKPYAAEHECIGKSVEEVRRLVQGRAKI